MTDSNHDIPPGLLAEVRDRLSSARYILGGDLDGWDPEDLLAGHVVDADPVTLRKAVRVIEAQGHEIPPDMLPKVGEAANLLAHYFDAEVTTLRRALRVIEAHRPLEDPPLIKGGQGRTPESLQSDAGWLIVWVVIAVVFSVGAAFGGLVL